ncbi:TPA: site-specific DNA-methyltransferase [Corynebacterium striatum]|uniref:site-specific DNA-methyltransferase n=1 Tax=Corynebacterium striatum TaxID=43770 RepID=UPI00194E72BA|nr:site-specific DNA-methyltransferase [Corynebacterium striatum]QRP17738.1 site-specific DNA-methyltransferase [Corynebacterium striatum]HAT1137934.1 site-specific DNA-methyltransferase [Corynebacterium striatum]HAT1197045.1 site-specific DNA-methyltransferase [Corynebacterium striatum]HAT1216236.1 site-specific DNA-methyltransferase [Corynebacterium striatum]HAT1249168.1 site-specific DNA-methyltransferase [Corynebacterium striatum]
MSKQKLEITWHNKDKALIPTTRGRYGYTWVDPTDPRYCQTNFLEYGDVVRGVQQPKQEGRTYSERADLDPQDDNLLILGESGDVLESLTRVPELADKYVGQVKCVYIDPPFNTAQTFANYEDNLEHSIWLTMMRDRLLHLKKLLSDDGSIWVHLDDVENHRMRMLMDEVFGAANFIAEVVWQKTYSPRNDSKGIPAVTDVILVYSKGRFVPNRLARTVEMNARYKNPDLDRNGPWKSGDTTAPGNMSGQKQHPSVFAVQHPITGEFIYPSYGRMWCFGQERLLESLSQYADYRCEAPNLVARSKRTGIPVENLRPDVCDLVVDETKRQGDKTQAMRRKAIGNWPEFFVTDTGFGRKVSLSLSEGRLATNFLPHTEVGHTDTAAKEIRALFPGTSAFATPKPERLLERIIHIATDPGDIVLDVFAGSGTTAAVAQKMGRRWVTCELVEDTFNRFTRPRLEKVVRGEDLGGITVTKGERVDASADGLPEGLTPEDAQKLTSLLNKAIRDEPELKKSADLRAVKQLVKTKKTPDTVNWRGGGGFTVARLSEPCFDVDEDTGTTMLTEHATAANLARAVAAHLRFAMTPDHPVFAAKRANMYLTVTRQPVTTEFIDEILGYVAEDEAVTVAATSAPPEVAEYLAKKCRGSRVIVIPDGLFLTTLSDKA